MKFEFVEFYETTDDKLPKNFVGTVHIYAIDCELDIRGIRVTLHGKGMFFNFPHFKAIEEDTGKPIMYPLIRWTNEKTHKEMLDFLHNEVKPLILGRLKPKDEL